MKYTLQKHWPRQQMTTADVINLFPKNNTPKLVVKPSKVSLDARREIRHVKVDMAFEALHEQFITAQAEYRRIAIRYYNVIAERILFDYREAKANEDTIQMATTLKRYRYFKTLYMNILNNTYLPTFSDKAIKP